MTQKEERIIKFNGGRLAILCNSCRTIVKQGNGIKEEDLNSKEPLFCIPCQVKRNTPLSSNGRITLSESVHLGSNPSEGTQQH